jgi:hypothetical protein
VATISGHLGRAGVRLGAAVEAYNAAVGSLERQVLPQARRFTDLGVTADAPLPALETVDSLARVPTPASMPVPAQFNSSGSGPRSVAGAAGGAEGAFDATGFPADTTGSGATGARADATNPGADVDSAASSAGDVRDT